MQIMASTQVNVAYDGTQGRFQKDQFKVDYTSTHMSWENCSRKVSVLI